MNEHNPKASVLANCRLIATLTHSRPTTQEDKNSKVLSQKVFLSSSFFLFTVCGFFPKATAQIVPDATLPVNSTVTPQGNTSVIEGGMSAGPNLFHSFREFSIPTNGTAFFNNAADIQNILTRVTGSSISNIDGLIRANGTANLFLINPNGIIFGSNAALNIGGSFLASTASQINFADGTQFSATAPQTGLLTVSVPVGLQMGPNPGSIVVQGSGNNLSADPETGATIRDNRPVGLQVAAGQTLALLGGNLALEGGNLTAEGGRIELGSVAPETLVTLTPINLGMALSYPEINNFQDISLSKAASVDASGAGGGDVFVAGRRVTLTDDSAILALTEGSEPGGILSVRASEVVELIGSSTKGQYASVLDASPATGATGEGGNVTIETARLRAVDGGYVTTGTSGPGKAGNLTVKATDTVELIGTSTDDGQSFTGLNASTEAGATGEGGNVTIETARLRVSDGALVVTGTSGPGKAGNLTVKATDTVELIGTSTDDGQYVSGLFATTEAGATGEGGNVTIETARLRVSDGALVVTTTYGPGKGGNLTLKATDTVEVIGTSANGQYSSALLATAATEATGEGGNVTIETARLRVSDGALVSTTTYGPGKGGNLTLKATDTVEVIGTTPDGQSSSALDASVQPGATGEGGNVTIETARLRVADGALVSTATFGFGKGGNLTLKATDTVEVIGTTPDGQSSSALDASAQSGATGEGGNLTIETARLQVSDGAVVSTITFGPGKAGNLTLKATDTVEVIGTTPDGQYPSALLATAATGATGEGGNLIIETARLRVADGAIASASSAGEGKAGNLIVDADSILLENSGSLTAETPAGGGTIELRSSTITLGNGSSISTNASGGESGGNIDVRSSALILRQGSRITTNATGSQVKGGNLTVNTDVMAAIENSDISANSEDARGGNITINAQAIFGSVFRTAEELERLLNTTDPLLLDPFQLPSSDITATGANSSLSGTVSVSTPDVDPAQGLLNLPETPVDATQLVASTCRRGKNQSEFNVTGRGGLPPNPYEAIADEATWIDLRPTAGKRASSRTEEQTIARQTQSSIVPTSQLIEAQGWVINSKGQVELVAQVPQVSPQITQFIPQQCHEQ